MNYYKLMYDGDNSKDYIDCDHYNIGSNDEYCLKAGRAITEWNNITFSYDSNEGNIISDYISNILDWLIVSEKFKYLLNKYSSIEGSCQFLPLVVSDYAGHNKPINAYALKVIDILINAIDFEKSDFVLLKYGDIEMKSFRKFVLKETEVIGHDIFILKDSPMYIFVSERIKELIINNKLLGFAFTEVTVV